MTNKKFCQLSFIILIFATIFLNYSCKPKAEVENKKLIILAVNDMHAAIENFPRFAFIVDSLREIYPDLLLVSAGDNQSGNPVNDQYPQKGMPIIDLMNMLKFDLCAVGNHEFDTKQDGFKHIINNANFDFICANIKLSSSIGLNIKPFKTIKMPNGLKIAFTSVISLNENGIPDTHPNNLKGIKFDNPFKVAKDYTYLKDEHDLLIYLNHFGFEEDVELAEQLPKGKVDLIIGGHSHTIVDEEQIINDILITQAGSKLKYCSLICLEIDKNYEVKKSMQLIEINKNGDIAQAFQEKLDYYNDNPFLNEKIAEAEDDFSSAEQIGYLMVDALRLQLNTDIAFINPGGVRISQLEKGDISIKDVYSMDPFGNEAIIFNLSGNEMKDMFFAAFALDDYMPIYPSGIKVKYILKNEKNIEDIIFYSEAGEVLDMEKTYSVSMNSYMASVYKYEHLDLGTGQFITTAENMIEYLKELETVPSYKNEKRVEIK
ncbi:MAG: bifunctional metallophosphatase/5'-nucleotidase [Bacteroidales bacterium]|nr:bifunctional metallophosphatase/5'-nucleotidase [Bacteroidales bacterium]MCK9498312.1 bifunctional metallophosphatase/5'-nucleotidase [Bacteroidales bacterium]MDY0314785.1 bifunctional UDP-sugar hydrolase/5'-nucleotidase [Bacteroidales bacterium]NLB85829.1 bifunctional metallophosphatase/5'-nucleotidase [Bacteroidales bacterium]